MKEYVDRKQVENALTMEAVKSSNCKIRTFARAISVLNSVPAADVAPVVHGKWIQCFEDWRMQIEGDKCSICGFEHYGTPRGEFKFCPNCGAKIDGGESK